MRNHNDPFAPNWSYAPEWAQWHTVSAMDSLDVDYAAEWWELPPIVEKWWDMDYKGNDYERETWDRHDPLSGCEWEEDRDWLIEIDGECVRDLDCRNSLRHRPETEP